MSKNSNILKFNILKIEAHFLKLEKLGSKEFQIYLFILEKMKRLGILKFFNQKLTFLENK